MIAENIELQGIGTSHSSVKFTTTTGHAVSWESKNGSDTIKSLMVNTAAHSQDVEKIRSTKALVWIKTIILVLVCAAVLAGFSVPIVIYYIEIDRGTDNTTFMINLNINNCPPSVNHSVQVRNPNQYIASYV